MVDRAPPTIKSSNLIFERVGCPSGTVPIQRTTKETLIRANSLTKEFRKRYQAADAHPLSAQSPGYHFASLRMFPGGYSSLHGAEVFINVYNPKVAREQFSTAQIWANNGVGNTLNSVQAGWIVNPYFHGDNETRIFSSWLGVGSGCWNIYCPGFVQVSSEVPLGAVLLPSVYKGSQYYMKTSITKDRESGNWWLILDNDLKLGYWPSKLFTTLVEGAGTIHMGGQVYSYSKQVYPEMGSGHFPYEDDGKYDRACVFRRVLLVNDEDSNFVPNVRESKLYASRPDCYDIGNFKNMGDPDNWGYTFLYGGPGGNCGI